MSIKHSDEKIKQAVVEWINADSPMDVIATKYGIKYNTLYGRAKNLLGHIARLPTEAKCLIRERGIKDYFNYSAKNNNHHAVKTQPSISVHAVKIPAELQAVKDLVERTPQGVEGYPSEGGDSIVLAIPDMHHPFCHQDTLEFLKAVRDKFACNKFLCLGDEIDAHAFSRYPKDPDGLTGGQEIQKARECLLPFYLEFPEMLICESNHTVRPWKQAFEAGLPSSFLPSYAMFLNAPDGWKWASRHVIDDVMYIHGDAGKSGFTAHINYMKAFKRSMVIGHIHSYAGVNYEGRHFGMNAGCLIDVEAYCFKYAKHMPISVNLGCGVIKNGNEAHFIPMHHDSHGRWTGKL